MLIIALVVLWPARGSALYTFLRFHGKPEELSLLASEFLVPKACCLSFPKHFSAWEMYLICLIYDIAWFLHFTSFSFKWLFYHGLRANWKLDILSLKIDLLINILSWFQSFCLLSSCCSCSAYSSQFSFGKNFPSNHTFQYPYSKKSLYPDLLLVTLAFLQAFQLCVV